MYMIIIRTTKHAMKAIEIEIASPDRSSSAGEAGGSKACRYFSRPPFTGTVVNSHPAVAPMRTE
jgi:hypothetical protein